ncbi:MAG TPA: metal ABC transporter permease [Ktedonobacterales bacterium]
MPPMLTESSVGVGPSWDLLADLTDLFHYPFMQHAFLAGTLVAVVAGALGYFMVLRRQSFAGHTLANVGFAGAAGAALVGQPPVVGLLVFGLAAALGIGWLSERAGEGSGSGQWRQDIAVGTVLAFSLGLGLLFERLTSSYAGGIYAILFGAALGVSERDITVIAITTGIALVALVFIGRPLFFASLDPLVAGARGVPVRVLSYVFLALLAFAVAQAVQVVGVLLIFSLLVTPGATAQQLTTRPGRAIVLSILLALVFTWVGLTIAYYTPYPVGFFITSCAFVTYVVVRLARLGVSAVGRNIRRGGADGISAEALASLERVAQ